MMSDSKRFDIREYMEEKVAKAKHSAGSHGAEITGNCPGCGRYGGFYVNVTSGRYLCNKCDLRGRNVAGLVAIIEGITDIEARAFIFRRSVEMRRRETVLSLRERLQAIRPHAGVQEAAIVTYVDDALPGEFRPCYAQVKGKDVWALPAYLKERGIKSTTAKAWRLGFCRAGRFAGRLIIPAECPNGRSFTARDMTDDQMPKYLNPTGTDFRRLLIGWTHARLTGDLVICEGPLDAVKLYQHSVSAVALGGKELHDEQLSMLMALPTSTEVTIMLDPDETLAPIKVAARLSTHFETIYISKLEEMDGPSERGKLDPGNCTSKEAYAALDAAVRWTGGRHSILRARLERSKKAAASRWG